ncbi:MAG: Ethanolamine utilization protein EutD [Acidimicrobiaceae bacterium]|nr:Ethanolamine utilization protein EutD [Acidimicrobiaceae bacterium]
MTGLVNTWYSRAAESPARVVLADLGDPRADEAAGRLTDQGLAVVVEPVVDRDEPMLAPVVAAARSAGLDSDDPVVAAATLVRAGLADAAVAGATRPTADVLRAGLRVIGAAPGVSLVSSSMLMVLPSGHAVVFADCGVVPDPDAAQLASIAVSSADTFEQLTGEQARVAMLSYSTMGSADGESVDKVRAATRLAADLAPGLAVDGELQFDAAWDPEVAAAKAPESEIAGRANVFVFPTLDSGNIAYKIAERMGAARAVGPLLQGLNGVLHDLSRGCTVDEIVDVAVIAGIQALCD